jgi:hypothetical protein
MPVRKIAHSVLILIVPMLFVGCGGYTNPPSMPPATAPQLALVANSISNSISIYAVDAQTGQLQAKEMLPSGGMNTRVLALEPSGRFAYAGNIGSNDISVFAIDANTRDTYRWWVLLYLRAAAHGSSSLGRWAMFSMR